MFAFWFGEAWARIIKSQIQPAELGGDACSLPGSGIDLTSSPSRTGNAAVRSRRKARDRRSGRASGDGLYAVHYGLTGWSTYADGHGARKTLSYRYNCCLPSAGRCTHLFGKRINGPIGTSLIVAAIGTIFEVLPLRSVSVWCSLTMA
ncbi:hypothetical protein ACLK19_02250 [Escherichia coli]